MKRTMQSKLGAVLAGLLLSGLLCLPFGLTTEAAPQNKQAAKKAVQQDDDNIGSPAWNGVVHLVVRGSLLFGGVVLVVMGGIILKLPEQSTTPRKEEEKQQKR